MKPAPDKPTPAPTHADQDTFQRRVNHWMNGSFASSIVTDKVERCDRLLEETLELVQSLGFGLERAQAMVRYVFDHPPGETFQEVGGVMVTLAALCNAQSLDMQTEAERELIRIGDPEVTAKIREKQANKPTGDALLAAFPAPGSLGEALYLIMKGDQGYPEPVCIPFRVLAQDTRDYFERVAAAFAAKAYEKLRHELSNQVGDRLDAVERAGFRKADDAQEQKTPVSETHETSNQS